MSFRNDKRIDEIDRQIMQLCADGMHAKQIGKNMFMSFRSVQNRIGRLRVTLNFKTLPHMVKIGIQQGLISYE